MSNKTVNFSDGEALEHGDLNDLQTLLMTRAIDGRDYSRGFHSHSAMLNPPSNFATDWGLGVGLSEKAWIRSGGDFSLRHVSGLQVNVSPGVIGTWGTTGPPNSTAHNFRWAQMDANHTVNHTTGAALVTGRYDLVSIEITDATSDSTSRDFKDAVTGALSSQSFDKRRTYAVNFQVTEGTDGGAPPALPAGRTALYSVFLGPGATVVDPTEIRDWTWPLGGVQSFTTKGVDCIYESGAWTPETAGPLTGGLVGGAIAFPDQQAGSTCAKLLGWEMVGDFHANGANLDLVRTSIGTGTWAAGTVLAAEGAHVGATTVKRSYNDVYTAVATNMPFWANGATNRIQPAAHDMIGVQVTPADVNTRKIQSVRWWFLVG